MEYCSLGDLSHYIKQARTNKSMKKGNVSGLPERVVRHFLKQLANALQFLRSQNLVHRDIKPQVREREEDDCIHVHFVYRICY
jgi:serine/threonine-protein kinase ULK/ATG1